jgi:hypothetical protein
MSASVEGVVGLFDRLKSVFSVRKGALLTRSKESRYFLPLAQTGLDITSRNRLRFPLEMLEAGSPGSWFSPPDRSGLRIYLSSREYDLCEDILMLLIFNGDEPAGMLMVMGEDEGELDYLRAVPTEKLEGLQRALGSFFERNKLFQISPSLESHPGAEELVQFVRRIQEQEREITAVRFDIQGLLRRLTEISADVDLFRARKDTLRIIETLFEGNSKIIPLEGDAYLLVLGTKRKQNLRLLQHQVGLALQNFFSDDQTQLLFTAIELPPLTDSPEKFVEEHLLKE